MLEMPVKQKSCRLEHSWTRLAMNSQLYGARHLSRFLPYFACSLAGGPILLSAVIWQRQRCCSVKSLSSRDITDKLPAAVDNTDALLICTSSISMLQASQAVVQANVNVITQRQLGCLKRRMHRTAHCNISLYAKLRGRSRHLHSLNAQLGTLSHQIMRHQEDLGWKAQQVKAAPVYVHSVMILQFGLSGPDYLASCVSFECCCSTVSIVHWGSVVKSTCITVQLSV